MGAGAARGRDGEPGGLKNAVFEEERPHLLGGTTTVRREPIEVVGTIAPWNYPQTLKVVTGGGRPSGLDAGWFVQPTVFAEVDNNSTIAQEEILGPVLSVIRYTDTDTDTDDAIRIANDSDYGLGAGYSLS